MKNMFKVIGIIVMIVLIGVSLMGCGNGFYYGSFTVSFSVGEGSGTPPRSIDHTYEVDNHGVSHGSRLDITMPGQGNMIAPAGKFFGGWKQSGSNHIYSEGQSTTVFSTTTFYAYWRDGLYANPGIYISLISFAGDANVITDTTAYNSRNFVLLNAAGKSTLNSILTNYYNRSSEASTALFYGVHKALSNLTENEGELSSDISSINLITFTDGLDNGSFGASLSAPIEGKSEMTSTDYAAYVSDEIKNKRKINGIPITAYSVGVMGADVTDEERFRENLGNIASNSDNINTITNYSELESIFSDIADDLSVATHFSMTTTQNDPGTVVRMTFDVSGTSSADADASSRYIEGTLGYSSGVWTLTNITYSGISSDVESGASITGTVSGNNINFMFRNIEGHDDAGRTIQQWTKPSAGSTTWQINSEYSASGSTTTSTVLIQLVLDASTSLNNSQITQIRSAVNQFINTLSSRTGD